MERLKDLFLTLLSLNRKLIYTALNDEDYFRVVNKLTIAGVKYKTKIINDIRFGRSSGHVNFKNKQYDIYVNKNDEYKAYEALNRRNQK